jgi:hypothetical protein
MKLHAELAWAMTLSHALEAVLGKALKRDRANMTPENFGHFRILVLQSY